MVFHDQNIDITEDLKKLERELSNIGWSEHCIHAGPVIRSEHEYGEYSLDERQNLRKAFKLICERKYLLSEVANHLEEEFSTDKNVMKIVEFIRTSKRGIYLRKDSCMTETFEE